MEILVILMISLVLFTITIFVTFFVVLKRNHNRKVYNISNDNLDLDEDDQDDYGALPIPLIVKDENKSDIGNDISFNVQKATNDSMSNVDQNIEDMNDNININIEGTSLKKENIELLGNSNTKEEKEKNIITNIPKISDNLSDTNTQELINVNINNRTYVFLANNNIVNKNDKINVLLNKHTYLGTVTRANYQKDISNFKVKPKKLIIAKMK